MDQIPLLSQIILYCCLFFNTLLGVILGIAQYLIYKGGKFKNPDNSSDSWKEQPILYGVAIADVLLSAPLLIISSILILLNFKFGFLMASWLAFWLIWANIMTTTTSLKFHKPKITPYWIFAFPFYILVGFVYLIWFMVYFDKIFS